MPPRVPPSRIAQALEYLQGIKSGVGEFAGGVGSNLADRAKAAGGLAYEALTSDPNMGRMNTAEFSEAAANRQTPRLDQAAQDIGTIGKAILTQPVQTGKAIVRGEVDRAKEATTSPEAAGQYAGSFVDPLRLAKLLGGGAPDIAELDVYHGTPHKYAPTEANPLGEFDASKIGTGEGAQAYGHGVYLAETPEVAMGYAKGVKDMGSVRAINDELSALAKTMQADETGEYGKYRSDAGRNAKKRYNELLGQRQKVIDQPGNLLKADLPDDMIDRMLDYDKPINEQSQIVLDALEKAGINTQSTALAGPMAQGQEAHLAKYGIPGIRYLDAGSRSNKGNGTRNFVVFPGEEKKIRILERK